jgi:hypothetical protein
VHIFEDLVGMFSLGRNQRAQVMRLLTYNTWRDSTYDFSRNGRYLEISAALDGPGSDCTQGTYTGSLTLSTSRCKLGAKRHHDQCEAEKDEEKAYVRGYGTGMAAAKTGAEVERVIGDHPPTRPRRQGVADRWHRCMVRAKTLKENPGSREKRSVVALEWYLVTNPEV